MPDHRRLILLATLVLAAWLFIEFFIFPEVLPERIESINLRGLWIVVGLFVLFNLLFKRILKDNPEVSLAYLVVLGMLITAFGEIIFQFYRQLTLVDIEPSERMRQFLTGVLGVGLFAGVPALSMATEVKYKKWWLSWIVTVGLMAGLYYVAVYFGFV